MTLPKLLQRCHGYDILRRISTNITRSTVRIISSVEISFFPTRILQFSYGLNSINHLNVQINHLHVHLVKLTQTPQPESQGIFMGIPDSFHHHLGNSRSGNCSKVAMEICPKNHGLEDVGSISWVLHMKGPWFKLEKMGVKSLTGPNMSHKLYPPGNEFIAHLGKKENHLLNCAKRDGTFVSFQQGIYTSN